MRERSKRAVVGSTYDSAPEVRARKARDRERETREREPHSVVSKSGDEGREGVRTK